MQQIRDAQISDAPAINRLSVQLGYEFSVERTSQILGELLNQPEYKRSDRH